jgi:UDP-N-acetylmuramoyl-tripeptide--D-alanyl-D-alanine ligase
MKPIALGEIRRIVGASADGGGEPLIAAICTDTRGMQSDSLFIALRGERFDGHDFLQAASTAGAIAAMVDGEVFPPAAMRIIRVADTRAAMGALARHVRKQHRGKVIAVAGSNGKTGTKYLIDSLLRADRRGLISPKSFNNDIGVPLSIFPADPMQDYLVLELGTNHPGEIRTLTNIALPDIAVITNCSAEHLEGLGDLDGVRRENASLIEGIAPGGLLIINGDDPALIEAAVSWRGRRVTFGFAPGNDLIASDVRCAADGIRFVIQPGNIETFVPLLGRHIAANALAAVAVAREMGLSHARIAKNLRGATGPEMRLQLQDVNGVRVLNDAYNANPASMKAAISTLASLDTGGRRIAIVGDMRELGKSSGEWHRSLGKWIAREHPPDLLACVGSEARAIAAEAICGGMPAARVRCYVDATAAAAIAKRLKKGDLVLLKASRAIGLETVAKAIAVDREV